MPLSSSLTATVRWLVRWRMKNARPIARGCTRLSDGPPSATASTILSVSRFRTWWLCSALATADRSTLEINRAAARGVYSRIASASPTDLPRICSSTRPAFRDETRMYFAVADVRMALRLPRRRGAGLLGLAVHPELARQCELAELVPDHVLGDVHGNELPSVVHGQRMADELRRDGRTARPGLEDLLLARAVQLPDALHELVIEVRAFLQRASHARAPTSSCESRCSGRRGAHRGASCSPSWVCPTASSDGCPCPCLRRRPSDDRPGS